MDSLERNGYAQLVTGANPTDAIAALEHSIPGEALACWNTDGPSLEDLIAATEAQPSAERRPVLATAPMVGLGTTVIADPLWEFYGLHTDHLGTVRVVTDVSGNPVSFHNYFPFGEEIAPQQFSYNTHEYTGHERDQATGLDYMLARYYEAGLGRFVSVDPGSDVKGELPQSWNKYTYTRNNPIGFFDPNGREMRPGQGADPVFWARFIGALEDAGDADKTGRVREAIDRVETSSNIFYVSPADGEVAQPLDETAAQNGMGSGGKATFNEEGQRSENDEFFTAEEVAAHLASHFEDFDSGTLILNPACSGCAPVTEVKATQMQNLVRDPQQPVTTHYNRKVPNPQGTPKRPSGSRDPGHHVQTVRLGVSQDDVLTGH